MVFKKEKKSCLQRTLKRNMSSHEVQKSIKITYQLTFNFIISDFEKKSWIKI